MKQPSINQCTGFQWDDGNSDKNWQKHGVLPMECEQIFFNEPLLLLDDTKHSAIEHRYYALGRTNTLRLLFVVFTLRGSLIRVISARTMSKKEQKIYAQE
jgi:uncharacterized DUF497 family protein